MGNVPLAVVLWQGGISFGGVIAFLFADLLILPILNIYRKYYGLRTAGFLLVTFYAAMVAAGYVVEFVFGGLGAVPDRSRATLPGGGITWNYTTWLNIIFLSLAAVLVVRFVSTGGVGMLRKMGALPTAMAAMERRADDRSRSPPCARELGGERRLHPATGVRRRVHRKADPRREPACGRPRLIH